MTYSYDGIIKVNNQIFHLQLDKIPDGFNTNEVFYKIRHKYNIFNDNPIVFKCNNMNIPIACYLDNNGILKQCSFCSGKKNKKCDRHIYDELDFKKCKKKYRRNKKKNNNMENNIIKHQEDKIDYNYINNYNIIEYITDDDELFFIRDICYYKYKFI